MFKTLGAAAITSAMLVVAAATAHADTLYVGGTGPDSATTKPTNLSWLDHGHFGTGATQVGYPAQLPGLGSSIQTGVDNLADAVDHSTGPVTIVGGSQGALVLEAYKERFNADPNARTDITFVEFADPASKFGLFGRNPGFTIPILNYRTTGPVQTKYTTTVISRQYDGAADWPTNQLNLLADLNAIAGFVYLHPNYGNVDLDGLQPQEVDGNTTYYRIPTEHLPILQPLRDLGFDQRILNAFEKPLKAFIDSAYAKPKPVTAMVAHPQAVTGHTPQKTGHHRSTCGDGRTTCKA